MVFGDESGTIYRYEDDFAQGGGQSNSRDRGYRRDQFGRDRRTSRSPSDSYRQRNRSRSPKMRAAAPEDDRYIPNYDREGYHPGARRRAASSQGRSYVGRSRPPTRGGDMDNPFNDGGDMAGPGGTRVNRMGVCDPKSINHVVSFHQFCEWVKSEEGARRYTKDELHERYEEYRRETLNRIFSEFYAAHKDDDWFIERYDPDKQEERRQEINSRKLPQLEAFLKDLRSGELDGISMDAPPDLPSDRDMHFKTSNRDPFDIPETADGDGDDEDTNTLFIRTVPPSVPRTAIEDECKKLEGFQYMTLSIPNAARNFHRYGWVKFKPGSDLDKALEALNTLRIDEFQFHFSKHRANSSAVYRLTPDVANTPDQLRHDLQLLKDAVKTLDKATDDERFDVLPEIEKRMEIIRTERGITSKPEASEPSMGEDTAGSPPPASAESPKEGAENGKPEREGENNSSDDSLDMVKKELDLCLEYCRRVHFYCYYCCKVMDSAEDFARQCAKSHYRRRLNSASSARTPSSHGWCKNVEQKNETIIYPPDIMEMYKYGGKSLKDETDRLMTGQINRLEEGRFRCVLCKKLFRGDEFVRKHIRNKHPELIPSELNKDIEFFNRFVLEAPQFVPLGANQAANVSGQGAGAMMGGGGGQRNMMMPQAMVMGPGGAIGSNAAMTFVPQSGMYGGFPMMNMMAGQNQMRMSNGMTFPVMYPFMPQPMAGGMIAGNPAAGGSFVGGNVGNDRGINGTSVSGGDSRNVRSYVDLDAPAESEPDYGF
ncbi:hypothetical protein EV182_000562 [Spiromyces aspiralis]|uniref:Uncharacterized protein n=1 Tax=Spiromyces aspiralis TaxID=68401 RepID=A0ACC1HGV2_9FUNG|nr:hypothetical protein EV182_000562 [Spiromyces aspiralis]